MSEHIARYCICGAAFSGTFAGDRIAWGKELAAEFERGHSGDGHGPTDARGASVARGRADRTGSPYPRPRPAKRKLIPLEAFGGGG